MKRGMPSGGHHSPTAFIFLVNSHSKKSLFLLTMGLAGRIRTMTGLRHRRNGPAGCGIRKFQLPFPQENPPIGTEKKDGMRNFAGKKSGSGRSAVFLFRSAPGMQGTRSAENSVITELPSSPCSSNNPPRTVWPETPFRTGPCIR